MNLAEIERDPEHVLGAGAPPADYRRFIAAVKKLMDAGVPEEKAIAILWDGGYWQSFLEVVLSGEWTPTHTIWTLEEGTSYVMRRGDDLFTYPDYTYWGLPSYSIEGTQLYYLGEEIVRENEWELTPLQGGGS